MILVGSTTSCTPISWFSSPWKCSLRSANTQAVKLALPVFHFSWLHILDGFMWSNTKQMSGFTLYLKSCRYRWGSFSSWLVSFFQFSSISLENSPTNKFGSKKSNKPQKPNLEKSNNQLLKFLRLIFGKLKIIMVHSKCFFKSLKPSDTKNNFTLWMFYTQ